MCDLQRIGIGASPIGNMSSLILTVNKSLAKSRTNVEENVSAEVIQ